MAFLSLWALRFLAQKQTTASSFLKVPSKKSEKCAEDRGNLATKDHGHRHLAVQHRWASHRYPLFAGLGGI
jgi:hypothetical protein